MDQGAMALVVFPDGRTRLQEIPVASANANLNSSKYLATLSESGALELLGTETFVGVRAASLRQEFEEVERQKVTLERDLNAMFPGIRVEEVRFSPLQALEEPVEYRYRASLERYAAVEERQMVIPVALFQHNVASAQAQLARRKLDIFVTNPWSTRNVVRYRLPEGAQIVALPESLSIETPHISLRQEVRRVEGGFETDDTVTMTSRRVPVDDYPAFRKACLAIDRALARRVVIQW